VDEIMRVDLGQREAELRRLAAAAGQADTQATLDRARSLMEELRRAPAQAWPAAEEPPARWQAARTEDGPRNVEILCWCEAENAQVKGIWRDGRLADIWVQAGPNFWSARQGPHGEVWTSSSADRSMGPGGTAYGADLERRARDAWQTAFADGPGPGWDCRECGWRNDPGVATCRMCLAPAAARPGSAARALRTGGIASVPAGVLPRTGNGGDAVELNDDWRALIEEFVSTAASHAGERLVGEKRSARRCPRCGRDLDSKARYCDRCGTELAVRSEPLQAVGWTCARCAADNRGDAKSCVRCSAPKPPPRPLDRPE
jgi:hypothetical protein